MKSFAIIAALAGAVAAAPATNPEKTPTASAPAGCSTDYSGTFEISVTNVSSSSTKRSVSKRTALTATLSKGILTDSEGRTGEIVANNQFQFDNPIQSNAIYTAGWSVCANGTLAIGDSALFYECLSGTFYNLYDASTGDQCSEIYINVIGTGSSVSQASDGQATAGVSQVTDGQIQATTGTAAVVTQITDGQIQATTGVVVSQITDGQLQAATSAAVVSQISDGQIQAATTSAAVPSSTAAVSGGATSAAATSAASTSAAASLQGGSTSAVSMFTGGAAYAAGSIGGVMAGLLGLIAAL